MNEPWIRRSQQTWKVGLFYVLMLITILLFGSFITAVNGVWLFGVSEGALAFAFVGTGIGGLAWLCASLRCPNCGKRPAWDLMRRGDAGGWLSDLHKLTHCPSCGS